MMLSGTESRDPKHGVDQQSYMINNHKFFQMDGKNYWICSNIKYGRVVGALLLTIKTGSSPYKEMVPIGTKLFQNRDLLGTMSKSNRDHM